MRQFDKLYNIIMEDYYAMDPEVSVKFFQSFKEVFNIIEKKIQEDPSLLNKIKKETQDWIDKDKATKTHAIFVSFAEKKILQKYGIKFTPEEQRIIDDADYVFNHIGGLRTYLHHNADKILRLAKRVGIVPKGIPGGKFKHAFHVGKVTTESYDPKDMYSGVYEPWPEEDFDIKVGQIFNIAERQIKRRPQILTQIQSDLDGFTGRKMELARAILLSVVRNLNKIRLGFDDKDILNGIQQYLGSNLNHFLQMTTGEIIRMAKNIGVNV